MKKKCVSMIFIVSAMLLAGCADQTGNIENGRSDTSITEETSEITTELLEGIETQTTEQATGDIDKESPATDTKENQESNEKEGFDDSENRTDTVVGLEEETTAEANKDYYAVCTDIEKEKVEAFASQVKRQILEQDWTALAEEIAYPITIAGVSYSDKAAFLAADLSVILTDTFVQDLENETCVDMFCNWQGIMLGNGEVWFGEVLNEDLTSQGLKVTAINYIE